MKKYLLALSVLFLAACGGGAPIFSAPPVAQVLPVESAPPIVVTPIEVVPPLVVPTPIVVPPAIVTPPPIVIAPVDPVTPIIIPPVVVPPVVVPPVVVIPPIVAPPPVATSSVVLAVGNSEPLTDAEFALHPILPPPVPGIALPQIRFTLGINSAITQTFYFTPFDVAMIATAVGTAQETAFLQAVKDAQDINNGSQTLAQLGITVSAGPAFYYTDTAGTARSIPSVLLTGAPGTTLTPVVWYLK